MSRKWFLLALIIATGCASSPETTSETPAAVEQVNDYPDIQLVLQNGEAIDARNLEGNNILMFFSPDCIHCHNEAREIRQNIEQFENYTLWFVSSREMAEIMEFATRYELLDRDNVRFAWSSTDGVLNFYGPIRIPSAYIYSGGRLRKSFDGPTPVDSLLQAL